MKEKEAIPIQKLHVENFGCVRHTTIELEPLTVLVGPNDSGKSTLLKVLPSLAAACLSEQGWMGAFPTPASLNAQTFHGRGDAIHVGLRGTIERVNYSYEVRVGADLLTDGIHHERLHWGSAEATSTESGIVFRDPPDSLDEGPYKWFGTNIPIVHSKYLTLRSGAADELNRFRTIFHPAMRLLSLLSCATVYSLRPEDLRRVSPPEIASMSAEREARLGTHGQGIAALIADLLLRGRDVLERIEGALTQAMPHVKRVDIKQHRQGQDKLPVNELELVIRSGARIPSTAISDGVLLYLGYLYLVLGPNPTPLLLVEEPETGLHPGMMRKLLTLFRDMTTGAHGGPPTQVILTTHSPLLLNLVEPHEIRVVQRGDDGATTVTPFTNAPELDALLDYQGPGEIWVNEGEEYIVGGKARS